MAQVAQHLGFAVVAVEGRVGQVVAGPDAVGGQGVGSLGVEGVEILGVGRDGEGPPQGDHRAAGGGLVKCEPHRVVVHRPEVEPFSQCGGHDL